MTLSDRLPRDRGPNELTRALAAMRAAGITVLDLTVSNPTAVGLAYPPGLLRALSAEAGLLYAPHPFGHQQAREAIAADCARRGADVSAADVVLSASTSESYAWLFKLLCSVGDAVLVPRPSYPLFEHLTRLEGIEAVGYELDFHRRWDIDFSTIAAAPERTRAILLVSPNNPTGSYVTRAEVVRVTALCRERNWAMIVDEVFADYALETDAPATDIAAEAGVLAFSLGGLSKSIGLPQLKLGWMVVGGPADDRAAALNGLELIADTYLSVGTPVQLAAPALLEQGAVVRAAIHDRVRGNLARTRAVVRRFPACELLPVEGGWSAVVRVPATRSEEQLVLEALRREHVLVHPGYFFDFAREAFIVLSLLPPEDLFADGLDRVLKVAVS